MNSQELRALQEAYSQVYAPQELDEAAIYKRGGKGQTTETPLQIYGKSATAREKKKLHNIPKGRIGADEVGEYDRGSGNAAKRRAKGLTKPEAKKFPNRLTRSDKQGIRDSYEYDLYDIILSHLLDEGYADTEQAAEAIMVNMSEDWRESIVEARMDPRGRPASGPMNVYANPKGKPDQAHLDAVKSYNEKQKKKTPEQRKAELDAYTERQLNNK
jgi:hypothetical protein